ncbi:hypothetical protein PS15m_001967 [Mucor circinelloides]
MSSRNPLPTRSESPLQNQHLNTIQSDQPRLFPMDQSTQTNFIAERPSSEQLSGTFPLRIEDSRSPSQQHETESDREEYEKTCVICGKSGLKGERGLMVHQRISKMCRRIMNARSENTQRQKSSKSNSGRREEQSESSGSFAVEAEDAFGVASSRSNVAGGDIADFMDDFIEKLSHLAHNRVSVVRIQVPQALVNILQYLNNEVFRKDILDRIENWFISLSQKITFAISERYFTI